MNGYKNVGAAQCRYRGLVGTVHVHVDVPALVRAVGHKAIRASTLQTTLGKGAVLLVARDVRKDARP